MRDRHQKQYTLRLMHLLAATSMARGPLGKLILREPGAVEVSDRRFLIQTEGNRVQVDLEPMKKGSTRIGSVLFTAPPNQRRFTKNVAARIAEGCPDWVAVDPKAVYPRETRFPRLPRSAERELEEGRTALARNQVSRAIIRFTTYLRKSGAKDAALWSELGELRIRTREWQRATHCFQKALAIEPGNARALAGLEVVKQKTASRRR